LDAAEHNRDEALSGALRCAGCARRYEVCAGIPRLLLGDDERGASATDRTAASFGHLWGHSVGRIVAQAPRAYHYDHLERVLALPALRGVVLDAGCGDGIDLANQARRGGVEMIGVDLSDGGCLSSFDATRTMTTAHVAQANLCRLPFQDGTFDFIYSFGVLHHLSSPERGIHELVRVLRPGGGLAIYLYEDFSERAWAWRWLLRLSNQLRRVTTRLPHRLLYALCQLGSPVAYLLFTVPARIFSHVPGGRALANSMPFRHGTGPCSLVGDLYDRFSAPVEQRYSRAEAAGLCRNTGLERLVVAHERGWMVAGLKPIQSAHVAEHPKQLFKPAAGAPVA